MSLDLDFITTKPMPIKALDSSRADYLRHEIAIAREKAAGADTAGRYDWAVFYEDRAEELARELREVTENSKT